MHLFVLFAHDSKGPDYDPYVRSSYIPGLRFPFAAALFVQAPSSRLLYGNALVLLFHDVQ